MLSILAHTYITFNVLFDHPHLRLSSNKECKDERTAYSAQLLEYSNQYYSEVKDLLTGGIKMRELTICDSLGDLCSTEVKQFNTEYSTNSTSSFKLRSKRFLPFIALAAGVASLGFSLYNTFTRSEVNGAVNSLNENQHKIMAQVNAQGVVAINSLIRVTDKIFTRVESYKSYVDHRFQETDCNINTKTEYLLSRIRSLHSKFERIISVVFRGQITPDLIDPINLSTMLKNHNEMKGTLLTKDLTLAYRLMKIIPLGVIESHMGISVLLKIPVITMSDISPVFSITNVGWTSGNNQYRLSLPDEIYMLKDKKIVDILVVDSGSCFNQNGLWVCEHTNPKTNHESSCLKSILLSDILNLHDCKIEIKRSLSSDIIPIKSGLLIKGNHKVTMLRSMTTGQKQIIKSSNYTYFPYSQDQSIEIDGTIYNSLYSTDILIQADIGLEDEGVNFFIEKTIHHEQWIKTDDLDQEILALRDIKISPILLQFPAILNTSVSLSFIFSSLFMIAICWVCYNRYRSHKEERSVSYNPETENLNMRSLRT